MIQTLQHLLTLSIEAIALTCSLFLMVGFICHVRRALIDRIDQTTICELLAIQADRQPIQVGPDFSIRELRLIAQLQGFSGYGRLTKSQLQVALSSA